MPPAPLAAAAGGTLAAAMYLSALTGSAGGMIMVYLAPLPLFLAGLAFGPAMALAAGTLATLLVFGIGGGFILPLTFLVFSVLPVVIVGRRVLLSRQGPDGGIQWYPPGLLLLSLTGLGVAAVLAAAALALVFAPAGGLKAVVHELLVGNLPLMLGTTTTADAAGSGIIEAITEVFPGMVSVSWLMMVVVNGLLAQALLARFDRLKRPVLRMTELELPGWAPLALAVTLLGAMVLEGEFGFLLVNLAIVQALPFFFSGLAVVHAFAARRAAKVAILVGFYLVLSFLAWPVVAVIGLGIIEQWAGLRGRFAAATPDRGEA
ncbi:MAG: DUF2232 domain-containing protein [Rhodospirillaceae bacterium]